MVIINRTYLHYSIYRKNIFIQAKHRDRWAAVIPLFKHVKHFVSRNGCAY